MVPYHWSHSNHSDTMSTPKTDTVLSGLLQLPDISPTLAEELVVKLRKAELALRQAEADMISAAHQIADEIISVNGSDGWSFDEIWKTELRGNPDIIIRLRYKKHDA